MLKLKKILSVYKKYRALALSIVGLVVILLPLVIVIDKGVEIISQLKAYHYIGEDIISRNTISVSGEGKIYSKPDTAIVNISVVSEGKKVVEVETENSRKTNQVIKFLKETGIEEKDIKTTGYNLYPRYIYYENRAPEISGYEITQALEVKIRDLDKTGEILEGAMKNGANQISSLYFKIDKDEELKDEARKLAIEDAKKKAEKLASQLGVNLAKLSSFSESGTPYPIYRGLEEYGIGGGGGAPQIQVGESEIIVNVVLVYEIN